ncbi:MAG: IS110 family transposase [Propionibacteriaceae bacterium]|nr:IS110 family transposase [Propionibacteriaceae bacterium]
MDIVANTHRFVTGVDCHAASHTFAIVDAATGGLVEVRSFPVTGAGLRRALDWMGRRTGGPAGALLVVEGTGSYGAGLALAAGRAGWRVVEAMPVTRAARGGRGKTDQIDAELIARTVLAVDADRLREPRALDGVRSALSTLLAARRHRQRARTATVNALTALVRTVDLGVDARRRLTHATIEGIAGWRTRPNDDLATATARRAAAELAQDIIAADLWLTDNARRLHALIAAGPASALLQRPGVGPVTAATVLTAWSHPGRVRTEAAFASLAGVNPVPASSGNTTRHRLNRGGDRTLNQALHQIALTRTRYDPATRDYVAKRTSQGKTPRETRRILKRYIARQLFHLLKNAPVAT